MSSPLNYGPAVAQLVFSQENLSWGWEVDGLFLPTGCVTGWPRSESDPSQQVVKKRPDLIPPSPSSLSTHSRGLLQPCRPPVVQPPFPCGWCGASQRVWQPCPGQVTAPIAWPPDQLSHCGPNRSISSSLSLCIKTEWWSNDWPLSLVGLAAFICQSLEIAFWLLCKNQRLKMFYQCHKQPQWFVGYHCKFTWSSQCPTIVGHQPSIAETWAERTTLWATFLATRG